MSNSDHERQRLAARHGDSLVRFPDWQRATHADFGSERTAIFIHGFTANAVYLTRLMHQFTGAGFKAIAFEYASFRGIDHAAKNLFRLLALFDADGTVSSHRIVLVAHSMGGLVARAFIALEGGAQFARKVITIGTPHRGTLRDSAIVQYLASHGEWLSGINPEGFAASGASALQLIGADGPPSLLERLMLPVTLPMPVQFYSIPGGYGWLEFGKNKRANDIANTWLQARLTAPNDGLVSESSSNLSGADFATCAPVCTHMNDYPDYSGTNHSYLVDNQTVSLEALRFSTSA